MCSTSSASRRVWTCAETGSGLRLCHGGPRSKMWSRRSAPRRASALISRSATRFCSAKAVTGRICSPCGCGARGTASRRTGQRPSGRPGDERLQNWLQRRPHARRTIRRRSRACTVARTLTQVSGSPTPPGTPSRPRRSCGRRSRP